MSVRDLFATRVNSTMMSINERFTYLQKKANQSQPPLLTIRAKNSALQQASAKNRRLAMQMERRLSAMAALKIKKKSIRQRLGVPSKTIGSVDIRDRLTPPVRGRGRVRGRGLGRGLGRGRATGRVRQSRGRSLRRSQSMQSLQGNLQRSASMQSLNQRQQIRGRSRSRSRAQTPSRKPRSNSAVRAPQRSPSVSRPERLNTGSFGPPSNGGQRRGRRNSVGLRNQRLRNPRNNRFGQNQRGGMNPSRQRQEKFQRMADINARRQSNGRGRGRGRERGRGRGRGRPIRGRIARGGQQTKTVMPTKEELDAQLEMYMANTKSHLDKEIDVYMKESGANAF